MSKHGSFWTTPLEDLCVVFCCWVWEWLVEVILKRPLWLTQRKMSRLRILMQMVMASFQRKTVMTPMHKCIRVQMKCVMVWTTTVVERWMRVCWKNTFRMLTQMDMEIPRVCWRLVRVQRGMSHFHQIVMIPTLWSIPQPKSCAMVWTMTAIHRLMKMLGCWSIQTEI